MSQHLHELTYDGDLEGLEYFIKLSGNSINFMKTIIITLEDEISNPDKFYRITNRLFGKGIKTNAQIKFCYLSGGSAIDFKKTKWGNVTNLHFDHLDSTALVKAIAAIPQLKGLDIEFWNYVDEEIDWSSVANSKIETLVLENPENDGPLENPTNFVLQLFKSLKCLQNAIMPEELHDVIFPKLEEAKNEYQHLQRLEIKYF